MVARNDLLREECGRIWSAAGRQSAAVTGSGRLRWLAPVLSLLSTGATFYLKRGSFRGSQCIQPLLSVATLAMKKRRRRANGELLPREDWPEG